MVELTKVICRDCGEKNELKFVSLGVDVRGYTESDLERSRAVLQELDERDRTVRELSSAKNTLESFIYEARGRINDEDDVVNEITDAAERGEFLKDLEAAEEWLWDNEEPETIEKYSLKMDLLKSDIQPVLTKASEIERRPGAVSKLKDVIAKAGKLHKKLDKKKTKWELAKTQVDKLATAVLNAKDWLKTNLNAQEELSKRDDPAFTVAQVWWKVAELGNIAEPLRKKAVEKGLNEKHYHAFKTEL